ncbi:hypothetical protein RRG08_022316 [Elysia crispata]|uniref:Uncharacterized protein n=1 Tax=Elysia crispata TaxID=231223 RepID=A0AAE0ZS57_9GAST|nr:hypothetical protein RRG08_022316 [Elysia crispata]
MDRYYRPDVKTFEHSGARDVRIPPDDIPLRTLRIENPVASDTAAGGTAETSFTNTTAAGVSGSVASLNTPVDVFTTNGLPPEQILIAGAANDYYKMLEVYQGLEPEVPDLSSFEVDIHGRLRLKEYPDINIVNTKTSKPNTLEYVVKQGG